jgi:hypothetical protein
MFATPYLKQTGIPSGSKRPIDSDDEDDNINRTTNDKKKNSDTHNKHQKNRFI